MNSKIDKKTVAALCGAVVTGLTAQAAGAAQDPFALKDLSSGYTVAAADEKTKEMACGEGKCGGKAKQPTPVKGMEHKCAGVTGGAKETKPAEGAAKPDDKGTPAAK